MKTQHVKSWYEWGGVEIEEIGSVDFLSQASSSVSFVNVGAQAFFTPDLRGNMPKIDFTVSVDAGATASCNIETREVNLGIQYAMGQTFASCGFDPKSPKGRFQLIGMINGSMIHEGLHLALTPKRSLHVIKSLESRYGDDIALWARLNNLVEDIYIEARAAKCAETQEMKRGNHWIAFKNDHLFSRERLDIDLTLTEEQGLNENNLEALMGYFKNTRLTRTKKLRRLLGQQIVDILTEIRRKAGNVNPVNRNEFSHRLYVAFNNRLNRVPNKNSQGDDQQQDSSGTQQPDKRPWGDEQPQPSSSTQQGEQEKSADETDNEDKNDSDLNDTGDQFSDEETDEDLAQEMSLMQSFIDRELNEDEPTKIGRNARRSPIKESELVQVIEDSQIGHNNVQFGFSWDIDFDSKFVRELQYLNETHNVPGLLRNRGTRMHKAALHRITTTGKIFSNWTEGETNPRREVIIAIDASSSTKGKIFGNEIATARKMATAMRKARIPYIVVAYTSSGRWGAAGKVILVDSYEMGKRSIGPDDKRWDALKNTYQGTTPTAPAIKMCREELFSKKGGAKYLFVLSDGRPDGEQDTIEEIEITRDAGIAVFSFSVLRDVVRYNNRIFGERYNIDASANALQSISSVLRKLMRGLV